MRGLARKRSSTTSSRSAITTIELLPVHTFLNDSHLLEKGLTNYWGYNSIGFFAPDPRYASDVPNSLREFKEMIARFHDGRPRGDPGRRLQPHGRGQRARPDALLQGHRQRVLLPPDAGPAALLHQRHRHREHAQHQPSPRHPDGDRQPALLGQRDAGRRLPLRSRHHPRARARRISIPRAAFSKRSGRTRLLARSN